MGDTSVPGVEASDLNDGDILALTREEVTENGQFRFVYVGREGEEPVTSDWISQEHKKKVLRSWVDGVKNAIIARSQDKLREANEAAMEARAKRIRDEQLGDGDNSAAEAGVSARASTLDAPTPVVRKEAPRARAENADPVSYVEEQLEICRERLASAERAQQDIIREVLTARRDYEKWNTLAAGLGVGSVAANLNNSVSASTGLHMLGIVPNRSDIQDVPSKSAVRDNRIRI
jgi:hypothetical protein